MHQYRQMTRPPAAAAHGATLKLQVAKTTSPEEHLPQQEGEGVFLLKLQGQRKASWLN